MAEKSGLGSLVIAEFVLMTAVPDIPGEGGLQTFRSWVSYCNDCINRKEGRCLTKGAERFPSGVCENYEPSEELDTYNRTFGPVPEGMDASPTKLREKRPDLEYKEVVLAA